MIRSLTRRAAIGLVLMTAAYVVPLVVTGVVGATPIAAAQNSDCGYSSDPGDYVPQGPYSGFDARLSLSPGGNFFVANTTNTLNQDVVKLRFRDGGSTIPGEFHTITDHCTSLAVTQIAGPSPKAPDTYRWDDVAPTEFSSPDIYLSAGTWRIDYKVTIAVARTFDGKLHVFTDTHSKKIVVAAAPPCAGYDDSGPLAGGFETRPQVDLSTPPGSKVAANTYRATTPTNNDEEWVLRATLNATQSSVSNDERQDACYRVFADPLAGNPNAPKSVSTREGQNRSHTFDLEPGRWNVGVEVRTSTVVDGTRYLTSLSTDAQIIDVASPVGLDVGPPGLPAGVKITAEAAGYHPAWGIAQTNWSSKLQLPQAKHWLRFRVQAATSAGQLVDLSDIAETAQLRVLVRGPGGQFYLPHAAFTDGDEAGYSFIQTNGVWNKLKDPGRYTIFVWMHDGERGAWSQPLQLTVT